LVAQQGGTKSLLQPDLSEEVQTLKKQCTEHVRMRVWKSTGTLAAARVESNKSKLKLEDKTLETLDSSPPTI
jgi:hypothetical protein